MTLRALPPAILAIAMVAAGCTPFGAEPAGPDSAPAPDASGGGDGGADDGEARREAGAGEPIAPDGAFVAHRTKLHGIKIDGTFDEWPSATVPFALTFESAEHTQYTSTGTNTSAQIFVAWDEDHIYFGARVTDSTPGKGTDTLNVHRNDSVHLYLDGDGKTDGSYDANTAMFVFDHLGVAKSYVNKVAGPQPLATGDNGVDFVVKSLTDGFALEAAVHRPAFGRATQLATDDVLGLDFALTDVAVPNVFAQFLIWRKTPGTCSTKCACDSDGQDLPNCNSLRFGKLRLAP